MRMSSYSPKALAMSKRKPPDSIWKMNFAKTVIPLTSIHFTPRKILVLLQCLARDMKTLVQVIRDSTVHLDIF